MKLVKHIENEYIREANQFLEERGAKSVRQFLLMYEVQLLIAELIKLNKELKK